MPYISRKIKKQNLREHGQWKQEQLIIQICMYISINMFLLLLKIYVSLFAAYIKMGKIFLLDEKEYFSYIY